MQSTLILEVSDLFIERGEKVLCENLSFQVNAGDVVHIVGENGAGKSSLLKVLAGILTPESGDMYFNGENISIYRDMLQAELFYLGHSAAIKAVFTVTENIRLYYPKATDEQIEAALLAVNLSDHIVTPAYQLSAGQKKRIALAKLWLTDKKVWLLDEPFTALDKKGIALMEQRFEEHVMSGGMIILTTHQALASTLNAKELHFTL